MESMELCGVFISDSGDVEDIYGQQGANVLELFCNNDPYGVISIYGLNGLKIDSISKMELKNVDGKFKTEYSDIYTYLFSALINDVRAKGARGLVLLKDGILVIKELTPFEAIKQPIRMGSEPDVKYEGYVDVSDVDESSEEFAILRAMYEGY